MRNHSKITTCRFALTDRQSYHIPRGECPKPELGSDPGPRRPRLWSGFPDDRRCRGTYCCRRSGGSNRLLWFAQASTIIRIRPREGGEESGIGESYLLVWSLVFLEAKDGSLVVTREVEGEVSICFVGNEVGSS